LRVFLEIYNDYDLFYFSTELYHDSASVELSNLNSFKNFLNFFQATLQKNKYLIISKNKNVLVPNLLQLKSSHFKIEHNEYIFLNYTLKNKIQKLNFKDDAFDSFQELELFLQENLSAIF
jgi:hypothetical protein